MHKLNIKMDAPGRGTVQLDGKDVQGVTAVEFKAGAGKVSVVRLELNVVDACVDAEDVATKDGEAIPTTRSTEAAIAALLSRLERVTGCTVGGVGIVETEVTRISDESRQFMRRVHIELDHAPGTGWEP